MDIQRAFNFEVADERAAALREALAPLRLGRWAVELVVLMAGSGKLVTINENRCYELTITKRSAGQAMGRAPNTFVAAAADLQLLGVMEVVKFGRQRTYYLSVDRVNLLVPIDDLSPEEMGLFADPEPEFGQRLVSDGQSWSAMVSDGQSARVRERSLGITGRGVTPELNQFG